MLRSLTPKADRRETIGNQKTETILTITQKLPDKINEIAKSITGTGTAASAVPEDKLLSLQEVLADTEDINNAAYEDLFGNYGKYGNKIDAIKDAAASGDRPALQSVINDILGNVSDVGAKIRSIDKDVESIVGALDKEKRKTARKVYSPLPFDKDSTAKIYSKIEELNVIDIRSAYVDAVAVSALEALCGSILREFRAENPPNVRWTNIMSLVHAFDGSKTDVLSYVKASVTKLETQARLDRANERKAVRMWKGNMQRWWINAKEQMGASDEEVNKLEARLKEGATDLSRSSAIEEWKLLNAFWLTHTAAVPNPQDKVALLTQNGTIHSTKDVEDMYALCEKLYLESLQNAQRKHSGQAGQAEKEPETARQGSEPANDLDQTMGPVPLPES